MTTRGGPAQLSPPPASSAVPHHPHPHLPPVVPKMHIAYLDGLRAVAVISVLVRHAWGLSGSPRIPLFGLDLRPIVVMLSSGVDLFFVLSGFLLARSFLRARQTGQPAPRYSDYWRARIRRIGPPFWIVLVLVVLFMTPTFIPEGKVFSTEGLAIFLAHVPIMQTIYLPAFGAYPVETPFWTLTIEMIFYLTLPFMVQLFFGKRWIIFTPILGAVALGWLYWVRNGADWLVAFENEKINVYPPFANEAIRFFLSHQFPAFLVDFSAGILAAVVVTSKKYRFKDSKLFQKLTSPTVGMIMFLIGLVALLAIMWVLGGLSLRHGYDNPLNYMYDDRRSDLVYYYFETIPFGIAYALILCGLALGPNWLKGLFSLRGLAFFGVIGYSVYLLHMPILYIVNRYEWVASDTDPSSHFLKLFLFGAPLIIAIAYCFYRVVERPSIAWSQEGRRIPPEAPIDPPDAADASADVAPAVQPVSGEASSIETAGDRHAAAPASPAAEPVLTPSGIGSGPAG